MFKKARDAITTKLLMTVVMALALQASTGAASANSANLAQFNWENYQWSGSINTTYEAQTHQLLVLQSGNGSLVAKLHAANPGVKIFMYMDPLDSKTTDTTGASVCTSYTSDAASHPNWFVLDQNGHRILYKGSTTNYIMDVGDPVYQQACVAHAVALAASFGFDGIFWDDIETGYAWVFPTGTTSPEYPTPTAYYNSFVSFLNYAGPQIRSQALLSMGNLGAATPTQWQQLTAPMDGSEEESFTDGGLGLAQQIPFWSNKLANVAWSEGHGKYALLHSYNATEAGNTYGLASMLLVAGGKASYSTASGGSLYTGSQTWYPEYDTAQQLGAPSGPYAKLANGAYERLFAGGLVLVNPTSSTIASFSLGGGTYSGSGLTSVSSLAMAPTSAYILLADGASPPVNMAPPSISGTAAVGQTLTANPGSWSGSPAPTYSYQWSDCTTASTSSCTPVAGANASTYTIQASDAGQYLDVAVTATNSAGSAQAPSATTAQIPSATPPSNTGLPAISGTVSIGRTLTANPGAWSGSPAPTYSYQWSDCTTASTSSCTPVAGANASTYTIQASDAGEYLDVTVTASNSAGSAQAMSATTAQVPAAGTPPSNTMLPTISGSFVVGESLSATSGSWSGTPAPTYSYQWSTCTTPSASSCTPTAGANASTYGVQTSDAGQYLDLTVTATNSAGSAQASVMTGQVPGTLTATAPIDISAPTISGAPISGQTLAAAPGTWLGNPPPSYGYQWSRCSTTSSSSCTPISGATANIYTVQPADAASYLDVAVTASNIAGSARVPSATTALVPVPTFALSASPRSQSVTRGAGTTYTITVSAISGFTGPVSLHIGRLPANVTATLSVSSTTTTSTLTISTTSSTPLGKFTLQLWGSAGGQVRFVTPTLTVSALSGGRLKRHHHRRLQGRRHLDPRLAR